jgi:hypothetical protein
VADNQTQHLYNDPFLMRSKIGVGLVGASVRPVQLDLYGQDLLRWVIDYDIKGKTQTPIIHLGDGLNFSCAVEMQRFFESMDRATQGQLPWVMAPGNHDGYFFGNEASSTFWNTACKRGGGPVDHSSFIRQYLAVIQKEFKLPSLQGERWQSSAPAPGQPTPFLDSMEWHIDSQRHYLSWIVQLVNLSESDPTLPRVYALLFDTSEYEQPPTLIANSKQVDAGSTGSILRDQIEAAQRLLDAHSNSAPSEKPVILLMGHHNFGALTEPTQKAIQALREKYHVALYVSAHTHHSQYFENGDSRWLELNLGSVLDWTPEYRTLSLNQSQDKKQIELKTPQHLLEADWAKGTEGTPHAADPTWQAKPGEPRYYMSFLEAGTFCVKGGLVCSSQMQQKLMETELEEIKYSISIFKTTSSRRWPQNTQSDQDVLAAIGAAKASHDVTRETELAQQLQAFDEERVAVPSDASPESQPGERHGEYRLWQALYASMRMRTRVTLPDSGQGFFVFPNTTNEDDK